MELELNFNPAKWKKREELRRSLEKYPMELVRDYFLAMVSDTPFKGVIEEYPKRVDFLLYQNEVLVGMVILKKS